MELTAQISHHIGTSTEKVLGFYDYRAEELRLHEMGWFVNIPPVGGHLGGGGGSWVAVANPSSPTSPDDPMRAQDQTLTLQCWFLNLALRFVNPWDSDSSNAIL